ncbi:F-box/kelch-repeat protein At3g23880-like [Impatiens glandulifera]|uniref:F-box/kelch-repeat protein At3g23880-like n=1 Tax=Impatiens glandulifera TaxID=253017 RepID=UPI001FB0F5A6|nr:F-box/kelch-repeat protein At3g23880-like [Impatiens glandulifera]
MDIKSDPSKHDGESMGQSSSAVDDSDSVHLATTLPAEIISDILIILPVKSLIRFKSVCKSWRALISDPIFVKAHLQGNIQDKDYASHRLIMKTDTPHYDLKSCSLSSVLNEESSITCLDYPWEHPPRSIRIIGSVNGLVCIRVDLSLYTSLYIWNPSTGKAKRLPDYGSTIYAEIISYGFGYDEANSDYKVVIIYLIIRPFDRSYNPQGKIYGLKSDSWRKIDDFYMRSQLYAYCTFVSGSLNWAVSGGTILSLDLSKETCSETELPFYLEEEMVCGNLGNLSGSLCQLSYVYGMMKIDLWVMKQFGKVESWSKMYSIPYQCEIETFKNYASLISSGKNKVLMLIGSVLMLYNLETKTVTHPDFQNLSNFLDVDAYIESLVSPDDASNNSIDEVIVEMVFIY